MKSLKKLLTKRLLPIPRWLPYLFGFLSLVGFADSVYLTASKIINFNLPCTIFQGCDIVNKSIYSSIGPVPVALLGALYYLTLLVISIYYFDTSNADAFYLFSKLTWVGLIFSGWFVYVQAFILHSYCTYCLMSATICAILFVLSLVYIKVIKD